jgi:hypothetical protein
VTFGKGATFSVTLPIASSAVATDHLPKGTQSKRISKISPDASPP